MLRGEIAKKIIQNAFKSTQIEIKLLRAKFEINMNQRTRFNFGRADMNPKIKRERKLGGEKNLPLNLQKINTSAALLAFEDTVEDDVSSPNSAARVA